MRRISSLRDLSTGISRGTDSVYENVEIVAENIDAIILASISADLALNYLGAAESPPATRLNGDPVENGDFYFDTTNGSEGTYYYDASQTSWFAGSSGGGGGGAVYDDTAILAAVALNTAKVTNVDHPIVEAAVPSGAVFTDTTYSIGNGGLTEVNFTSAKDTKLTSIETGANNYALPFTDNSDDWNLAHSWGDHSTAGYVTSTYDDTAISAAVALNTAKISNIDHPLVEKAVPSNAIFTDTTYSVGDGGLTQNNFTNSLKTKLDDMLSAASQSSALSSKQDVLVSGTTLKTINSVSLLGSGNIDIAAGGGGISDAPVDGNQYSRQDSGWVLSSVGSIAWGTVTGTLSDQTDLNTALGLKADSSQVLTNVPSGALFTDTDTVYDPTAIEAAVALNTAKVSNVDHPLVETSVPSGAVFTDTVYDDTAIQAQVDLNTAKVGITTAQANDIVANNAKVSNVDYDDTAVYSAIGGKQDTLVSNTNVKTVNGTSILGPGDIVVAAGSTPTDSETKTAYENNADTNAFTDAEKAKLSSVADSANNYTHPANHPASVIAQDSNNRFVTDAEKASWNGNTAIQVVTAYPGSPVAGTLYILVPA